MGEARVVDTNVLIVASAADSASPFQPGATPVQEAKLRQQVLDWLIEFEQDDECHAVIDWDWHICGEYQNKLTEQDYGWLAIMSKKDRNQVVWVGLDIDADGHAILPDSIAPSITDLADRKMVAAIFAAQAEEWICKLANACDTDWIDCEKALKSHGIYAEHIIERWLRSKWKSMQPEK